MKSTFTPKQNHLPPMPISHRGKHPGDIFRGQGVLFLAAYPEIVEYGLQPQDDAVSLFGDQEMFPVKQRKGGIRMVVNELSDIGGIAI